MVREWPGLIAGCIIAGIFLPASAAAAPLPSGAEKATPKPATVIAHNMVNALGGAAVLVGMDGYHLAQSELARVGRAGRKGAPDTFDPAGYI